MVLVWTGQDFGLLAVLSAVALGFLFWKFGPRLRRASRVAGGAFKGNRFPRRSGPLAKGGYVLLALALLLLLMEAWLGSLLVGVAGFVFLRGAGR